MNVADQETSQLYQKRIPIFTRSVKGKFRTFKWATMALAYGVYFLLPWLPWQRGHEAPSQSVLFDLPGRKFYLFDLVVYPQDIFWLSLLLFIAGALLFFATGLIGRAFCGYFCFQTLWTDAFIAIEKLVQGERPARQRLYKQPWNREKILKLSLTHSLWLLLAFWTAFTFILYFAYAPELIVRFMGGKASNIAYFTVLIITATTYVAAGWAREQVCLYMCPYARFQGVMYDPETLAVAYDSRRGEGEAGRAVPRAGFRTQEERKSKGHGDCIDCKLCIQVCPTGIDIRKGLQYQCIACGLCIDACNSMMDSMSYPRGLIRYDSEANLALPVPAKPRLHWKSPKVVGWGIALLVMTIWLINSIGHRSNLDATVQQIRQPLFTTLSDGKIRNRYQVRITNKSVEDESYVISSRGLPEHALEMGNFSEVKVHAGKSLIIQAGVSLLPKQAESTHNFEFVVTPRTFPDQALQLGTRFDFKHE
ncbi:MAG: cytochrome c oxidase accessory protein CcoG [Sulfurimicrobium sp.]|jgi:cytochrome c oxidase accessory protein FixG|nr:cytochrome c oxidase accessory protein CcoG [Sulfurimicrobium sp.]MDP2961824.1 cytochrome c oxidase accessory protein CcoG [Sulfurimicrobium sp.]MDZ7656393.1 cytochrome c oxidase accessory protein CcoG [Sulfurimicrobium sp.]